MFEILNEFKTLINDYRKQNLNLDLFTCSYFTGKNNSYFWFKNNSSWKCILCFPGGSDSKGSPCNAGDLGLIPGLGRSPEEGNGNPFQYSCLKNPMDSRVCWAKVYGVTKSWTQLSNLKSTLKPPNLHNIT